MRVFRGHHLYCFFAPFRCLNSLQHTICVSHRPSIIQRSKKRKKRRKVDKQRIQKTILILLDFVGYYLCNLIFHHHCLWGASDDVMAKKIRNKNKEEKKFSPSFYLVCLLSKSIFTETYIRTHISIYLFIYTYGITTDVMERLSGFPA